MTTNTLSPSEIADLKESFDAFDYNKDGTISRRELHSLLHTIGHKVDTKGLEAILAEHDTNADGTISFNEFLGLATRFIDHKV
ncbi:hypothetical protein EMPS_02298 [Entomortierella parvispora]|uniref:EF-hand domain-containing protein n=1 Tax=Entomortierella parvispora TaxID=205924 RepID=A0A9P3H4L8_9FUNG|nr:hypothetical protein EMPS_02298 [Entomortierella parvispora]